jgi:hypothetical protein
MTVPSALARASAAALAALALALPAITPSPAEAAKRPKCVKITHDAGIVSQTVYVHNRCKTRTFSFIVHKQGFDSPCLHVSPFNIRSYRWTNGLNYQGTTFGCD